jgi:hypothetical protein
LKKLAVKEQKLTINKKKTTNAFEKVAPLIFYTKDRTAGQLFQKRLFYPKAIIIND